MLIALILAPYDTALRGWRSGAGPEQLIEAGLAAHLERQGHSIVSIEAIEDPERPPAEIRTAFALMRGVAVAARRAREAGALPIVLSGNCNVAAVGQLSALAPAPRSIFWFDAHGEANTPDTSSSGFLDGMGLSMVLGWTWRSLCESVPGFVATSAATAFLLGARDLDAPELARLQHESVARIPVDASVDQLARHFEGAPLRDTVGYLHLDLDVLDPSEVGTANSLPAARGLTVPQLVQTIQLIRSRVTLGAVSLASYAPEFDRNREIQAAAFAALSACVAERT